MTGSGHIDALDALGRVLSSAGTPHMIIGELAVIARGIVRQSNDIDATVWGPGLDVHPLVQALADAGITGRIDDLQGFAVKAQVLLLRHEHSGTPINLSFAWLPFEEAALERAERLSLGGVTLPVAAAEDLVIYKALAWRDRDRADIARLHRLHGGSMDVERILEVVGRLCRALEEPKRVGELAGLLRGG